MLSHISRTGEEGQTAGRGKTPAGEEEIGGPAKRRNTSPSDRLSEEKRQVTRGI